MRLHTLMALTVGLLVAADAPKDEAAKKDLEKLQGTWALVSAERDGKRLPDAEVKKTKITFAGDTFVFPDASGIGRGRAGMEHSTAGTDVGASRTGAGRVGTKRVPARIEA